MEAGIKPHDMEGTVNGPRTGEQRQLADVPLKAE